MSACVLHSQGYLSTGPHYFSGCFKSLDSTYCNIGLAQSNCLRCLYLSLYLCQSLKYQFFHSIVKFCIIHFFTASHLGMKCCIIEKRLLGCLTSLHTEILQCLKSESAIRGTGLLLVARPVRVDLLDKSPAGGLQCDSNSQTLNTFMC